MSEKHKRDEHAPQENAEHVSENTQSCEDFEKVALEARTNLEGWKRTQADFQNYKKRVENERAEMAVLYKADAVKPFLALADDMERATQNVPQEIAESPWFAGFKMLQNDLNKAFAENKVETFGEVGEEFDPNIHQAVNEEEGQAGKIVSVYSKGYRVGPRILRPAAVSVGRG